MDRIRNMEEQGDCGGKFLYIHPLSPLPFSALIFMQRDIGIFCLLLAAFLHEMGHIVVILLLKGKIGQIRIEPFGFKILLKGDFLNYKSSMLVNMAGVITNLLSALPLFFVESENPFYLFYVSSLALGLFNSLPISMLDGGVFLKNFLLLFLEEEKAEKVSRITSHITAFFLVILSLFLLFSSFFNPMLLLLSLYLFFSCE